MLEYDLETVWTVEDGFLDAGRVRYGMGCVQAVVDGAGAERLVRYSFIWFPKKTWEKAQKVENTKRCEN